jgi:DnaJ-class molecular chaperone
MTTHTSLTAPAQQLSADFHWVSCPSCWGQRRIWEFIEAGNGEGRIPVHHTCPECMGLGELLR